MFEKIIVFVLLLVFCLIGRGQDTVVTVKGKVTQDVPLGFADLLIVNNNTGKGVWGKPDGTFEIKIKKDHTIKVASRGYHTATISFKDSVYQDIYHVNVELKLLTVEYDRPVTIRPKPSLEEVDEARSKIGTHEYDPFVRPKITSAASPISLLYQLFSKEEERKQQYIALLNQHEYEKAMEEIIRFFVKSELFFLTEDEFDQFIRFCGLSQSFIKNASAYDVGDALNECYQNYSKIHRW